MFLPNLCFYCRYPIIIIFLKLDEMRIYLCYNLYMDRFLHSYDHITLEKEWQNYWRTTALTSPLSDAKRPYYNLMMFPYPSAEGLHVGNMYAFTGSDIYGRYMRMQGYDVLEPIGLDGFGIHSENYALKVGRHPKEHARISEKNFYAQLEKIGAGFDWKRTVETYNPSYYRWTQWIFTQMFRHGLAYRGVASVNWCSSCKTVLSDEQAVQKDVEGVQTTACERCGNKVEKRSLEQWFFKITAYAGKLLDNIPKLDWAEKVKGAQTAWIGKKEGITITYPVYDADGTSIGSIDCFTTRPDTNFGATFIVVAPEHQCLSNYSKHIDKDINSAISQYQKITKAKTEQERLADGKKKTGVATGLYAVNELNGLHLPIYISDFVLGGFGTGAVVGVPGHDVRDYDFAVAMSIPITRVVVGTDGDDSPITKREQVQESDGTMINSDFLNGMDIHAATVAMMDHLEKKKWGKRTTTFHLRDWTISRQRYWGAPIPMIYCETCAGATRGEQPSMPGWWTVPDADLPVLLPDIEDYKPRDDGVGPLSKHEEFYHTVCPHCGASARRETDVCDTFLDSSWYFLRYPTLGSIEADTMAFDPEITKHWLPVAMYTGGAEHSVLHLLYSRFITMCLHDFKFIDFDEPFTTFFAHGLVIKDGAKMSKSKGNVVNPDVYIEKYGADALRMYLMFMGPFADGGDFSDTAMEGMHRFTSRIWRLVMKSAKDHSEETDKLTRRQLARAIDRATQDIPKRRYNTTISGFMEFVTVASQEKSTLSVADARTFVQIIAPFAPHIAEALWRRLSGVGGETSDIPPGYGSVHVSKWPMIEKELLIDETIQFVIQVNGKVREVVSVPRKDAGNEEMMKTLALSLEKVQKYVAGNILKKTIFVPGKILNMCV